MKRLVLTQMVCCKAWDAAPRAIRQRRKRQGMDNYPAVSATRSRLGPPPRYERREVFNAIMYVTKTGWLDGSAGCASSSLTQPIAVNSLLGCTSSLGVKAPAFPLFQGSGTAFAFWLSAGSSRELSLGLLTPVDSSSRKNRLQHGSRWHTI